MMEAAGSMPRNMERNNNVSENSLLTMKEGKKLIDCVCCSIQMVCRHTDIFQ